MREVTIKAFGIRELNEKAQARVLQDYVDINVTGDWYSPIIEGFKENMESYGVDAEPYFSGFWSQGDGACFISNTLDTDKLVRSLYEEGYDIPEDALLYSGDYSLNIQKINNHYDHENTVEARYYDGEQISASRVGREDSEKLEQVVTDWVRERSRNLYRDLEKYYTELTTDESIMETLEENEYLFTESGKLIVTN